jgi:hypothetical protein
MSKHHKGGSRGKKGSSGSSRRTTVEEAPVTGNMTQPRNNRQTRSPLRCEQKHHDGSVADRQRGDGEGQQAGPSGADCSRPVRPDRNVSENEQANAASHLVSDEAAGPQMERPAQSDSTMTVFGTSFLCSCPECQLDNHVLAEMFHTHPHKNYFIALLKEQRAKHEARHVALSAGLSPRAPEFRPHDQSSEKQTRSSLPAMVSSVRDSTDHRGY